MMQSIASLRPRQLLSGLSQVRLGLDLARPDFEAVLRNQVNLIYSR